MSARSLLIFVTVGIFAGLAFGIYLVDLRQTSQLMFVDGASLSLVTTKSDFEQGEPISIRIVNSGTVPLTFRDDSYGLVITGLSGMLMYDPVSAQAEQTLGPHDETVVVWNQIKDDGDPALEGLYKIRAAGADQHGNTVEKSITITILKRSM